MAGKQKSMKLALCLSALAPGLGAWYAQAPIMGIFAASASAGSWFAVFVWSVPWFGCVSFFCSTFISLQVTADSVNTYNNRHNSRRNTSHARD
jgi:hypothetical protein